MKNYILLDSSFLIPSINESDKFRKDAVYVLNKIFENKKEIKLIIPSIVFYETIVTLIKKGGVSKEVIEKKLWNILNHDMILNVSLIETNAFKICKKLANYDLAQLKTQDFIIVNVGIEYESQILTFDKQMRRRLNKIYPEIYYCSAIGNMADETPRFLKDLNHKLGIDNEEIDLDNIPF